MPADRPPLASGRSPRIAYLAPEIPALSATFVHDELLALEARGVAVEPFSVRRPDRPAADQTDLAQRTRILYDRPAAALVVAGLAALPAFGRGSLKTLRWLAHDMVATGLHRSMAWKLAFQCLVGALLARRLQRAGCTHLHVHFAHTPAQIAMYASAFSGIPFTVMAHANDLFERGLLLREKAERAVRLLTISRFNLAYLRSRQVPAGQLALVRCGVPPAGRREAPPTPTGPRHRLGTLCRLVEKKGVDDLLRALPLLNGAGCAVDLLIAGEGPEKDRLVLLARELGVAGQAHFVGALGHEAVGDWLRTLDAFAVACKTDANGDMDGIPVVLMEAMSHGVPVVSTRLSGIPELVIHDETGLLADPAAPKSLADALGRLFGDAALRARLVEAAARHVENEFGRDVNLDRLMIHLGLPPRPPQPPRLTMKTKYVLISPGRNEAQYMRRTLDSVIAQTIRPALWVIVDDGSTDATPAILAAYTAQHAWIRVVTRSDRGKRSVGPGVVEAFYSGYAEIVPDDYDFLCKLDLDLELPTAYFEGLMRRMDADPRIATCSGKAYIRKNDRLVNERHGDETSIGASKFYRMSCFQALGGFVREVMWDGIDCHRCRMHGWSACSWDDPDLRFLHLRPMGSSDVGVLTGRMRHGYGQWFMGTGFSYMLANAVNRLGEKPYLLGSLAMVWGWLKSASLRKPRYEEPGFRAFLRSYQWRALVFGKRRAVAWAMRQEQHAA
ncbi:MAG: glycosyltransferase [Caldimonas sp.]